MLEISKKKKKKNFIKYNETMSNVTKNGYLKNQIDSYELMTKLILLNFKFLNENKFQLILLLMFPIIWILLPLIFIPLKQSFPIYIFCGVVFPTGLIYISTIYAWRKSTLFNVQLLTKIDKTKLYISSWILMELFALMLLFIAILMIFLLRNSLPKYWGWMNKGDEQMYAISKIPILGLIYVTGLDVTILFGLLYALRKLFKTKESAYIFLLSLLIFDIIFGGGFNCYFAQSTAILEVGTVIPVFDEGALYPTSLFWPTLIAFPFFAPAMQLSSIGMMTRVYFDTAGEMIISVAGVTQNLSGEFIINDFNFWSWSQNGLQLAAKEEEIYTIDNAAIKWNICWFVPYIWITIFGIFGIIFEDKK